MSHFSPPAGAPVVDIDFTSWQMCNDPYPVLREIRELGPLVWNKRGHWMTARDKVCREILNRPGPLGQEGAMRNFFGDEAFISIDEVAPPQCVAWRLDDRFPSRRADGRDPRHPQLCRRHVGEGCGPIPRRRKPGSRPRFLPSPAGLCHRLYDGHPRRYDADGRRVERPDGQFRPRAASRSITTTTPPGSPASAPRKSSAPISTSKSIIGAVIVARI
jgi:hypothetical protein